MMINKRAQSILEYVLVFTAVLLAIIAAIGSESGPIRSGLKNFFDQLGTMIGGIITG
jgi:Flp pilus assembly pilin Flp